MSPNPTSSSLGRRAATKTTREVPGSRSRTGRRDFLTSASYDLQAKKNAYRRNGVREYIVWRVFDRAIDWFVLREGEYQPLAADADGILHSEVFAGLRLAAQNMLDGDLAGVLTAQG